MDTWWIDEPYLLGSRNPSGSDLERLRRDGFSVLVSLLREKEQAPQYDIARATALGYVRYNIPVPDFSPPTPTAKTILDAYPGICDRLNTAKAEALGTLTWPSIIKPVQIVSQMAIV